MGATTPLGSQPSAGSSATADLGKEVARSILRHRTFIAHDRAPAGANGESVRRGVKATVCISGAALLGCGQLAFMSHVFADTSPVSESAWATEPDASSAPFQAPSPRALPSVLVKEIKRTVRFAPMSAELDAESLQILESAARLVPESATRVKIRAVGYVQPSAFRGNDISLSTRRARVVAAALLDEGIEGDTSVSGRGRAEQQGAGARRVEVVISFTPVG